MTHLPHPPQRLTRKFYKSKNSSNFLSPTSQEFSMSNKSSWALGWWWESMAYQMTHLPPPPQRLTRKFFKSKNSSNFLSPTSQEFSKSKRSSWALGWWGEAYGMPDDPSPTTNSNFGKKIFYIQKVKKFSKHKSRNFLNLKCQEIF